MKKLLVTLVILIAMMMLAGCADDTDTAADEGAGNQGDEPVVITALMYVGPHSGEPAELPSMIGFQEATNVQIEWTIVRAGWDDQKALLLAARDLPDTFWGNLTIDIRDIQANPELFAPLNDFIANSTNISRMFEEEPDLLSFVTFPDGNIYSLPHRMPLRPDTFDNTFINQVWLDNLGLPMPDCLDSFKYTLIAFRDRDPNGNGIADEIPYTWPGGTSSMFGTHWLFGAFGLTCNIWGERIMIRDGELIFTPTEDGWRDAILYMRDLYAEGLIDMEAFTQDWGMAFAKWQDPAVLVGVTNQWSKSAAFGPNAYQYATLPPLRGVDGERRWRSNPINLRSAPNTWVMSADASNPEAAFALIDHIYDPANGVQLYFGSYGVGIEKLEDGRVELLPPGDPDMTNDAWMWYIAFNDMGPYYVSREFEELIIPNDWVLSRLDSDMLFRPYLQDPADIFPTMIYSPEDTQELAVLRTDIDNFVEMRLAAWVTGERDIIADWDEYLQQLEGMGLPRKMEIYRARFDLFQGN